MPKQTRTNLKQYFLTGNTPTEDQFADLIDSALNTIDDPIVADANGQVGIGTAAPTAKLEVAGSLKAVSFSGDGAAVTNIQAANVAGFIPLAQIPDLPAEKITGVLDPSKLPSIPASQISGTLDASKIATGTIDPARLPAVDTGPIDVARIPALDASKIATGTIDPARLPAVDTGPIDVARIPALDASKIATGTIDPARLPAVDTGPIDVARIPLIPASQITGQLSAAQLPVDPIPLLVSLLQRIRVLEGKAGITSAMPSLGFNGSSTHVVLDKNNGGGGETLMGVRNSGFTFQAWVNPATSAGDLPLIVVQHEPGSPFLTQVPIYLPGSSASFCLSIRNGYLYYRHANYPGPQCEVTTSQALPANAWTLVTFVKTYLGAALYMNQTCLCRQSLTSIWQGTSYRWIFGRLGNSYFNGRIAAISLWAGPQMFQNTDTAPALSQNGVLDRANLPTLQGQGLGGYWPFDEGIGAVANDATTNGNYGHIIDPVWPGGR
jgi:hypothetical protein